MAVNWRTARVHQGTKGESAVSPQHLTMRNSRGSCQSSQRQSHTIPDVEHWHFSSFGWLTSSLVKLGECLVCACVLCLCFSISSRAFHKPFIIIFWSLFPFLLFVCIYLNNWNWPLGSWAFGTEKGTQRLFQIRAALRMTADKLILFTNYVCHQQRSKLLFLVYKHKHSFSPFLLQAAPRNANLYEATWSVLQLIWNHCGREYGCRVFKHCKVNHFNASHMVLFLVSSVLCEMWYRSFLSSLEC